MKNDVEMQQTIVAELEAEKAVPAGSIGVEVHHGVVKLAGTVSDPEALKSSARAAQRVEGVTDVIMDVDIAGARPAI